MAVDLNLLFGWVWIGMGLVAGAVIGLWFHDEAWLGGYASWRRRMMRLGHIAFFGTGWINLQLWLTIKLLSPLNEFPLSTYLLITGGIAMPLICFLSAWQKPFRHLFFIPVTCLILGVLNYIYFGLIPIYFE